MITLVVSAFTLSHSPYVYASENLPSNLDKTCEFIAHSISEGAEAESREASLILDSSGKEIAELKFKPSITNWKLVVLSLWEEQDYPVAQVRVTPPCKIMSVRRFGTNNDGDPIIISSSPNNETLSVEPQNPPFLISVKPEKTFRAPLIALIDTGVNYNLPLVQEHLAIDQHGQLVGYDFWDNDNRPFDKDPRKNPFFPLHHGTTVFSVLSKNLDGLKTAIYRFPANNMCRFTDLIEHAEKTGIKIINMSMGSNSPDDWACFEDSAKKHPEILFIVSAGNDGINIDINPVFPASLDLENMVVVTSSDLFGRLPPHANYGKRSVDLMVPAEQVDVFDHRGVYTTTGGSSYAAPKVAALAARYLAKNEAASAPDIVNFLKSRAIVRGSKFVKFGWIPDPRDNFKF